MQFIKDDISTIDKNHMPIPWHSFTNEKDNTPAEDASLNEKSTVIARVGFMLLSCGTGAFRVRSSMNQIAKALGITCSADIGLVSLECTCMDEGKSRTQVMTLTSTGVNTAKLARLEQFVHDFPEKYSRLPVEVIHQKLDEQDKIKDGYKPLTLGLAAGFACSGFTLLLGGGFIEMLCAFLGAGIGNYVRVQLIHRKYTLMLQIVAGVAAACMVYTIAFRMLELTCGISPNHEAGYICAMLFIIPGFPFITSGIDLAKLDLRSGIERLTYAALIILVSTLTGWIMAVAFRLKPDDFLPLGLGIGVLALLRFLASFCGVFGFSIMFGSPYKMAFLAGVIGAIVNTTRLELIDLVGMPPAAAAFSCAFLAGILASLLKPFCGYPRISITVPSIVIMVPGMYLYKAIYNMGTGVIMDASHWMTEAVLIMAALPLGLIFARILTDKEFRYSI